MWLLEMLAAIFISDVDAQLKMENAFIAIRSTLSLFNSMYSRFFSFFSVSCSFCFQLEDRTHFQIDRSFMVDTKFKRFLSVCSTEFTEQVLAVTFCVSNGIKNQSKQSFRYPFRALFTPQNQQTKRRKWKLFLYEPTKCELLAFVTIKWKRMAKNK